jgi:hypothetical protein
VELKTDEQREYQKKYYQANRERLLAKSRERYKNDPEYRAKILAVTRKRGGMIDTMKSGVGSSFRVRLPKKIKLNGKETWGYGIYYLAQKVGKSIPTVNSWEQKGLLPATPFRSGGGHRLYTARQIDAVVEVVRSRGMARLPNHDQDFYREVVEKWKTCGVTPNGGKNNGRRRIGRGAERD